VKHTFFCHRWGFNESVIWFQVQVQTLGYVGFGISETGKMVPADVFVAYVTDNRKDNLAYFKVSKFIMTVSPVMFCKSYFLILILQKCFIQANY
jgi:hypothetical protein